MRIITAQENIKSFKNNNNFWKNWKHFYDKSSSHYNNPLWKIYKAVLWYELNLFDYINIKVRLN